MGCYKYNEMSDKTIYTRSKDPVPWVDRTTEMFLDMTTFIFGGSKSGKTTIIEEILYLTREHCPNYIIICPETSVTAYQKKLPSRCIKEDLDKKTMQEIWKRQNWLTQIYNIANDMDTLKSLFRKAPDRETYALITAMEYAATRQIKLIREMTELNHAQRKAQISDVEKILNKKTKDLIKKFIKENKEKLLELKLTRKEKAAVDYHDLNPKLCLIIDDCTEKLPTWLKYFKKSEENVLQSILFRGRHNNITMIVAAHDDKFLTTELRKNAHVTIFTQMSALQASLNKDGTGYGKKEKKRAEEIGEAVFDEEDATIKTYRVLVLLKNVTHPFRYTIADLHSEFIIGGKCLYDMVELMPKQRDTLEENPYIINEAPRAKKQTPPFGKSNRRKYN